MWAALFLNSFSLWAPMNLSCGLPCGLAPLHTGQGGLGGIFGKLWGKPGGTLWAALLAGSLEESSRGGRPWGSLWCGPPCGLAFMKKHGEVFGGTLWVGFSGESSTGAGGLGRTLGEPCALLRGLALLNKIIWSSCPSCGRGCLKREVALICFSPPRRLGGSMGESLVGHCGLAFLTRMIGEEGFGGTLRGGLVHLVKEVGDREGPWGSLWGTPPLPAALLLLSSPLFPCNFVSFCIVGFGQGF